MTALLDSGCYPWLADSLTLVFSPVCMYSIYRSVLDQQDTPPGHQAISGSISDCAQPSELSGHGTGEHHLFGGPFPRACKHKPTVQQLQLINLCFPVPLQGFFICSIGRIWPLLNVSLHQPTPKPSSLGRGSAYKRHSSGCRRHGPGHRCLPRRAPYSPHYQNLAICAQWD